MTYYNIHFCQSIQQQPVGDPHPIATAVSQNAINKSYQVRVKVNNKPSWSPSNPGHPQTLWVKEARRSQATYIMLLGKAKQKGIHQNLLQCLITSQVLVPSSCVHYYSQKVLAKWLISSTIKFKSKIFRYSMI